MQRPTGIPRLAGQSEYYPVGSSAVFALERFTPNGITRITPPPQVQAGVAAQGGFVNRGDLVVMPLSPYEMHWQAEERLKQMQRDPSLYIRQVTPESRASAAYGGLDDMFESMGLGGI